MNCIYPSSLNMWHCFAYCSSLLEAMRQSGEVASPERFKMENVLICIPCRRLMVPLSALWEIPPLTGLVQWTASLKASRFTSLHILKSKHILQLCFVFSKKA